MEENSVINWLNLYFKGNTIDENQLKPILHFSLLWNLFENTYFTDEIHLNPLRLISLSEISFEELDDVIIDSLFDFFKSRYLDNNQTNNKFNLLQIHQSTIQFCSDILHASNPTKQEKVKFLFVVIHRFRNNLFHGRKHPKTLNIYKDVFYKINKFLMHFIECTSGNNDVNNNRHQ